MINIKDIVISQADFEYLDSAGAVIYEIDKLIDQSILQAKAFVSAYCGRKAFPEERQGYTKSKLAPATDITMISSNKIYVDVDGYGGREITLDLSQCDTGLHIAAELQKQIRALSNDFRHQTVVVRYIPPTVATDSEASPPVAQSEDDHYLTTSGTYGIESKIRYYLLSYNINYNVAYSLGLTKNFGAYELRGDINNEQLFAATAQLVIDQIRSQQLVNKGFAGSNGSKSATPILINQINPQLIDIFNQHRWI